MFQRDTSVVPHSQSAALHWTVRHFVSNMQMAGNISFTFMQISAMNLDENYRLAAETLMSADALLIGAGAGMGVDSGLPDFRGPLPVGALTALRAIVDEMNPLES